MPDLSSLFKMAFDASDVAAGAVLLQGNDEGVEHPVCYFSKKYNKSGKNYFTTEIECLAPVLAIQHFKVHKLKAKSTISEVEFKITRVCFGHQTQKERTMLLKNVSQEYKFLSKKFSNFFP